MIRPNELRIGNWVYIPSRKEEGVEMPAKIRELRGTDVTTYGNRKRSDSYLCLNPVPLKEELLLKCGFDVLVGRSCYSWVDKIYSTPDNNLVLYCKNNSYRFARERFGIGGWTLVDVNGYNFICLHQLQNLYFVLTGQELNVNL
ncbi:MULTISPECIES: hypothetical protein [Butyricimonas]|uniref:hypothetical protein n=1 Tax=Butyricimonas TaxID=574697 RepID=UPI0007FB47B3|nr:MULTISPECIES: hypothetical protein [Butyricimonas]